MFGDSFFKRVEKKTNINKETILSLADKLQRSNMKDDNTYGTGINKLDIDGGIGNIDITFESLRR